MTVLTAVTMPKWGLAMEEGTVTAWLIAEGAPVAAGVELLEVETSKIANVVEAAASGTLLRITAEAGIVLPVGALLAVIGDADTPVHLIERFVAERQALAAERSQVADAGGPQSIDLDGKAITYIDVGSGDAPPLLLLHGFGGDRNNWLFNLAAWSVDRRVIAVDLPGHGASSKDVGDGSLAAQAAVVGALIEALDLARVIVAGHSMGGGVALTLALDAPGRIAGLVLLDSMGLGPDVDRRFVDDLLAADRRKDMKPVLERLFADPALVSLDMTEAMLSFKRIDGVQAALETLALNALSNASSAALASRANKLAVPLLALHGVDDMIIPLPSARVEPVANAGHMVHMEAAALVNARVAAFAASLS